MADTSMLCEYDDKKAADYVDVPRWIEQDITAADVAAIVQGGCGSGAYMPAVTYSDALDSMRDHGDDVFDYLQESIGEIPMPPEELRESWAGMATFYLSAAVELWASAIEEELAEAIEEELTDDADDD